MLLDLIVMSMILDYGFIQVVGIVPTLLVVQVGLGRAVNPVNTSIGGTMPSLEAKRPNTESHTISTRRRRRFILKVMVVSEISFQYLPQFLPSEPDKGKSQKSSN